MFDLLEADIVVFQETKIQRKDLRDDMVLVPGWDCYWSLPRHKKGYAGVVIYTRNSVCAPTRAEEGIAGVLCPPNSKTSFRDLPEDQQIGGYPTMEQLSESEVDAVTLDSEGRCVILEFPAFVILGVYCPANRDESRDNFRLGFLNVLDARVRNLVKMGKRVILTGDINISREEIDTAAAEETMRKNGLPGVEYCSTPARRLFNQLLVDGKVFGPPDEGREQPVLCDVTRAFHPTRKGMYTCWETKINARPGNFGSRIDYVLCSAEMKDWFSDSNIQEGLLGSDHCPVYAVIKDEIEIDGAKRHILDMVNPPGMFQGGQRIMQWSMKDLLPMSGKLIPEFDRRRSIRDMFSKKPALPKEQSTAGEDSQEPTRPEPTPEPTTCSAQPTSFVSKGNSADSRVKSTPSPQKSSVGKRPAREESNIAPLKKTKSGTITPANGKGQQSLAGFFKPKTAPASTTGSGNNSINGDTIPTFVATDRDKLFPRSPFPAVTSKSDTSTSSSQMVTRITSNASDATTVDPEAAKQSWGNLMRRPVAPMCEHDEPCKTMLTKKPGINCGRSFWMCARPLGPSGQKEKGTEWRCATFIWASDWNGIEKEQASKAREGN